MSAYSESLHGRHDLLNGLRELADWLETDATKPTPENMLVGIRLRTVGAVLAFARLHQLSEPVTDHGTIHADAVFGPVVYRVYAKTGKAGTR